MKNTILTLFALLIVSSNYAQKMEDLGSPTPFSIGLKGTIYKYTVPKYFTSENHRRILKQKDTQQNLLFQNCLYK